MKILISRVVLKWVTWRYGSNAWLVVALGGVSSSNLGLYRPVYSFCQSE